MFAQIFGSIRNVSSHQSHQAGHRHVCTAPGGWVFAAPGVGIDVGRHKTSVVSSIEAALELPVGATPLGTYRRHYMLDATKSEVRALFIYDPAHPGVVYNTSGRLPEVMDGGCGIVNVISRLTARQIVSVFFNGVS
jgi:hypothetical protein